MTAENPTPESTALPQLQTLARERLPEHDLWAGIDVRLRPRRRVQASWPYGLAASVSVAFIAVALLRAPQPAAVATPVPTLAALPATAPGSDAAPYGEPQGKWQLSNRTLRTLRSESLGNAPTLVAERADGPGLLKATYPVGGRIAHSQQAILRANLRLVTQAEREVRRALKSDPDSASLNSLLAIAEEKRAWLTTLLVQGQD